MGGRKFGFLNVGPMSCAPFGKALAKGGNCFEQITPFVKLHNQQLDKLLHKLKSQLKGFKYSLAHSYTVLKQRMNRPSKFGN